MSIYSTISKKIDQQVIHNLNAPSVDAAKELLRKVGIGDVTAFEQVFIFYRYAKVNPDTKEALSFINEAYKIGSVNPDWLKETNYYPKEQTDFLQAVYDMRNAQRAYFAQPGKYRLEISKAREQRVDALLKPYIQAGAIKAETPVTNAKTLFE